METQTYLSKSLSKHNTKAEKRNVIWFNPPYSKNIAKKVDHHFLKLILFPPHYNSQTIQQE